MSGDVFLVHGPRLPAHDQRQLSHPVDDPAERPAGRIHLVLDGDLPERDAVLGRDLAPARHRVEELRLAVRLAHDGQERRQQRQAEHGDLAVEHLAQRLEVRFDGQRKGVQDPATAGAHGLRVDHAGELGPEPLELLVAQGLLRILHEQHERVAEGAVREAVDGHRLDHAATGRGADQVDHEAALARQDELDGVRVLALRDVREGELHGDPGLLGQLEAAEQPWVVGQIAEDAGHHGPVLSHDAEGAGERAGLVQLDAHPGDRLAEQAAGQVAESAGPGCVRAGAGLHHRTEDVVEELGVGRDSHVMPPRPCRSAGRRSRPRCRARAPCRSRRCGVPRRGPRWRCPGT